MMLNEHDLNDWRKEMISPEQAQEALNKMDEEGAITASEFFLLEEFIKQYRDLQKVKALPFILKPKKEQ